MNIILALGVGLLFGSGIYLMLKRDLIRLVAGIILISNATNLFIISAGLFQGQAPIYPFALDATISDPLVQALVLTAIVISFGVSSLVLTMVYRIYTTHRSLDQADLQQAEEQEVTQLEQNKWLD